MIIGSSILLASMLKLSDKLMILGGLVAFTCILYFVLPKLLNRRIRGYHEQCEIPEEEQNVGNEEENDD